MRLHTLASVQPPRVTASELPIEESPAGIAWQTQRPVVLRDIEHETRFPEVTRILRDEGIRSACVLPLTSPLRAGRRVLRLGSDPTAPVVTTGGARHAHIEGFDLHANGAVRAGENERLEHLCRYILRPPVA